MIISFVWNEYCGYNAIPLLSFIWLRYIATFSVQCIKIDNFEKNPLIRFFLLAAVCILFMAFPWIIDTQSDFLGISLL